MKVIIFVKLLIFQELIELKSNKKKLHQKEDFSYFII